MLSVRLSNNVRFILLFSVTAVLFSCAPPSKVAVEERVTIDRNVAIDRIGGSLVRHVAPGETLYSIAFEMGLDVNEVAAWNGVEDTTKLPVGKRIRLTKPIGFVTPPKPVLSETNDRRIVVEPIEKSNVENSAPVKPQTRPASTDSNNTQTFVGAEPMATKAASLTAWAWPLKGKIVRGFSQAQGHQGVDILGKLGQAVLATNMGEVVYVGNGLKGYGNLVIIKHSDVFLSAYAHNSEIYVREGEHVSTQQRIASVGVNRNKQNALHFQIRKNGQPVNPVSYLSK